MNQSISSSKQDNGALPPTKVKAKKRGLRQTVDDDHWRPLSPAEIHIDEGFKRTYTQEENFKSYQLFTIMDADQSGKISLDELQRVLNGEKLRSIIVDFDHPDTGMVWGLDEDNCVVITSIEVGSPAQENVKLLPGLRLKRIDSHEIPLFEKGSLERTLEILGEIYNQPLQFEFMDPLITISAFTYSLDIEVDGEMYCVQLPIGAVNNLEVFKETIEMCMAEEEELLSDIQVDIEPRTRQFRFYCEDYPFRLMFGTGPNYQTSCRFAIGFWAEDTPLEQEHIGTPMTIDLNLEISEHEVDILMKELFTKFNVSGTGEFEFEEFRDFFVKCLYKQESIDMLKKYAKYRFRDQEKELFLTKIYNQRLHRHERRKRLQEKNGKVLQEQNDRRLPVFKGSDGYTRRIKQEVHIDQTGQTVSLPLIPTFSSAAMRNNGLKVTTTTTTTAAAGGTGTMREGRGSGSGGMNMLESIDELSLVEQAAIYGEDAIGEAEEGYHQYRDIGSPESQYFQQQHPLPTTSIIEKEQVEKESRKLRRERDKEKRVRAKKHAEALRSKKVKEVMKNVTSYISQAQKTEDEEQLRMALSDAVTKGPPDDSGVRHLLVDSTVIRTPAIQSVSDASTAPVTYTDITLKPVPVTMMHPATTNYFMIPSSLEEEWDVTKRHPAFFNAQFQRNGSRHSTLALSVARLMLSRRQPISLPDNDDDEDDNDENNSNGNQVTNTTIEKGGGGGLPTTLEEEGDDNLGFQTGNGIVKGDEQEWPVLGQFNSKGGGVVDGASLVNESVNIPSSLEVANISPQYHTISPPPPPSSPSPPQPMPSSVQTEDIPVIPYTKPNALQFTLPRTLKGNLTSIEVIHLRRGESSAASRFITISCGDWKKKTHVMKGSTSWALGWKVEFNSNSSIHANLMIVNTLIGSESILAEGDITVQDILRTPTTHSNDLKVKCSLLSNGKEMGSLILHFKLAVEVEVEDSCITPDNLVKPPDFKDLKVIHARLTQFRTLEAIAAIAVIKPVPKDADADEWLPLQTDADAVLHSGPLPPSEYVSNNTYTKLNIQVDNTTDSAKVLVENLENSNSDPIPTMSHPSKETIIGEEGTTIRTSFLQPSRPISPKDKHDPVDPVLNVMDGTNQITLTKDSSRIMSTEPRPATATATAIRPPSTAGAKTFPVLRAYVQGQWWAETPRLWGGKSAMSSRTKLINWHGLTWAPFQLYQSIDENLQIEIWDNVLIGQGSMSFKEVKERIRLILNEESGMIQKDKAFDKTSLTLTIDIKLQLQPIYGGGMLRTSMTLLVSRNSFLWEPPAVNNAYFSTIELKKPKSRRKRKIKEQSGQLVPPENQDVKLVRIKTVTRTERDWITYPLTPISTGVIRQKFGVIVKEYDKQMVVHPCFFGFSVRWRAPPEKESQYVNPIFSGYQLSRKPPTQAEKDDLQRMKRRGALNNPFRYVPSNENCIVCFDGLPGCPRCFMMPQRPEGGSFIPEDFSFDPEMDNKITSAKELVRIYEAMREETKKKKKRHMRRLASYGSTADSCLTDDLELNQTNALMNAEAELEKLLKRNNGVQLHTTLTTAKAIRIYRNVSMKFFTVYLKALPTGHIRKLQVDPSYSAWNLFNMFQVHSNFGVEDRQMIILPTAAGAYEIDNDISGEDDYCNGRDTGRLPLSKFNLSMRGATICLLYYPLYQRHVVPSLLRSFIHDNTSTSLPPKYDVYSHSEGIPEDLSIDFVQIAIRAPIERLYKQQLLDEKIRYDHLASQRRMAVEKERLDGINKMLREKEYQEFEAKASQRRIDSQIKRIHESMHSKSLRLLESNEDGNSLLNSKSLS